MSEGFLEISTVRPLFLYWLKRVRVPWEKFLMISFSSAVKSRTQVSLGFKSVVFLAWFLKILTKSGFLGSILIKMAEFSLARFLRLFRAFLKFWAFSATGP